MTLLGNHDQGAMFDPDGFNIGAERAIFWTREQLESPDRPGQQRAALGVPGRAAADPPRWARSCSSTARPATRSASTSSPRTSTTTARWSGSSSWSSATASRATPTSPGVFTESFQFYAPEEIDNEYTLGEGKMMVNVGSVGQPRDGDNRGLLRDPRRRAGGRRGRRRGGRVGPAPVPPGSRIRRLHLRLRDDDPEDLRHPRARTVPGRPAPTRTLVLHATLPKVGSSRVETPRSCRCGCNRPTRSGRSVTGHADGPPVARTRDPLQSAGRLTGRGTDRRRVGMCRGRAPSFHCLRRGPRVRSP